ncbi:hypothetical protein QBC42DRAFT_167155 [Cladorrhinum samala]|uniref:Uncharacterized protein n=1 Tax=Cladorrhinum samala TaxID=585594 RepID=A0AAV9HZH0_9PEZI|nr:hypothetical protein QBC42DRAFT_167155 [Cladorrhinum samala]
MKPRVCEEFAWNWSGSASKAYGDLSLRPPKAQHQPPLISSPSDRLLADRSSAEVALLQAAFEGPFICHFILGPSFVDAERGKLYAALSRFPDALLSGFLACSGRFLSLMASETLMIGDGRTDVYAHSARAVKGLREIAICKTRRDETDLVVAMVLGLGAVTFNLLDTGSYAHSVCRYTIGLLCTPPLPGEGVPELLEDGLIPLVFMDTCNCLIRRQVPVFRLGGLGSSQHRRGRDSSMDRYIGLCASLLPHLYDLCSVSHLIKSNHNMITAAAEVKLSAIKTAIQEWTPPDQVGGVTRLSVKEVQVLTAQALIYQAAALLLIHRLRFVFGTEDEAADAMAASILDDISGLYHVVDDIEQDSGNKGPAPQQQQRRHFFEYRLGLPFLVAAAELREQRRRDGALDMLDRVVWKKMYPKVGEQLRRLILYIWEARDYGWKGNWVDLTLHGPPFVLF